MTPITLHHLQPQLSQQLQHRAEQNARTVEAEITAILTNVLASESAPEGLAPQEPELATAIRQCFAEVGGFELPEIPREPIREPSTF
ncbi:MAG: plasmid stabilization protein [Spirulina sp. SIO3F2]|nr:plasmid stabilization protein [Spirulina sp. SIO3F2]